MPGNVSDKTVARLSMYRRILNRAAAERTERLFSHELAAMAGGTAAQVRRDLMVTGYSGSPNKGYAVNELIEAISDFIDPPEPEPVVLIGIGNLGRAILAYFSGRRPGLLIQAAFDVEQSLTNRVINGVRTYPMESLGDILEEQKIRVAIIAVPGSEAQGVVDKLADAGVLGLINFAPVPLRVPSHVYVENVDMTASLETVAYFANQRAASFGERRATGDLSRKEER